MFAPARTPLPIVEKLSAEAKRGLQRPDFVNMAETQGTEILGSSPQELARVVRTEVQTWRKVVQNSTTRP
jgi:tripartite-type tricarboxylate transporter receptor subunit TctC